MKLAPLTFVAVALRPKSGAVAAALVDQDDVAIVEAVAREADVRPEEAEDVLRVLGVVR